MWHSQDDIVKDLASLDDFNVHGDRELHKVLYSIGRGSKFKNKPKSLQKFLDTRTGEIIDGGEILDYSDLYKGKGRGSLLGGLSRSKFQLQQQLRLARPLGSGDEAIESYFRRNEPRGNSKCSVSTSDSESESSKTEKNYPGISNTNLNSDIMKHRIKAVRNSSLENNALITGLLTKSKEKSKIYLTIKKGEFNNNFVEENLNITSNIKNHTNSIIKDSIFNTDSAEAVTEGNFMNSFNVAKEHLKEELDSKNFCSKDIYRYPCETAEADEGSQTVTTDGLKIIDDDDDDDDDKELMEKQQRQKVGKEEGSKNYPKNNFIDYAKGKSDRNERYRKYGEKINTLHECYPKASKNGIYNFSQISRSIAALDVDIISNSVPVTVDGPVSGYIMFNDDHFPPLGN